MTPPVATFEQDLGGVRADNAEVSPQWWDLFGDAVLTRLEIRAAAQNLSLQAAAARVGQSRAQLKIAGADMYPQVGANASILRERASPNGIMQLTGSPTAPTASSAGGSDTFGTTAMPGSDGSPPYTVWQAGLDASWELDLWGRVRRGREAAAADDLASRYDVEAVKVALAAEVASTYISLRSEQAQLRIAQDNRELAAHTLALSRSRESNGVATRLDSASAAAQLATIEASIPSLQTQVHAHMNALALLLGEPPRALEGELGAGADIPAPPAQLPVGLPSELAHRRPDILMAEARLHAATARIGVAKANFYPSLNLAGSFGLQALQSVNLGDLGSRIFAVGPVLNLPLFQGGRLEGTLALTEARQQESAIAFQATVLKAWHEVDDALNNFAGSQRQEAQLRIAVEQSQIAYRAAQRRYEEGAADYLAVLIAQRDQLANERALAQGHAALSTAMVSLYKALGGGWPADASRQAPDKTANRADQATDGRG